MSSISNVLCLILGKQTSHCFGCSGEVRLTAAKCPRQTERPMANGAEPVTSRRLLSVTAMTHSTSWKVARSSMPTPWLGVTPLSCERVREKESKTTAVCQSVSVRRIVSHHRRFPLSSRWHRRTAIWQKSHTAYLLVISFVEKPEHCYSVHLSCGTPCIGLCSASTVNRCHDLKLFDKKTADVTHYR